MKLLLSIVILSFSIGCASKKVMRADSKAVVDGVMAVEGIWVKSKSKKFDLAYRIRNLSSSTTLLIPTNSIACFAGDFEGQIKSSTMTTTKVKVARQPTFSNSINYKVEHDTANAAARREDESLVDEQVIPLHPGEAKSFQLNCTFPESVEGNRRLTFSSIKDEKSGEVVIKSLEFVVTK